MKIHAPPPSPAMSPREVDWATSLRLIEREHYPFAAMGKTTEQVCRPLINFAVQGGGCPLAHVWSVDPRRGRLILIADEAAESIAELRPSAEDYIDVIDVESSLTGLVVESKQIRLFKEFKDAHGRRRFQDERLLDLVNSMLSIPVRNIGNPNQVLSVVNLFLSSSKVQIPQSALQLHARLLADALESNLRERAFRASMGVSRRLGMLDVLTEEAAYRTFADCIREAVDSDEVTIFVEDWSQSQLSCRVVSSSKGNLDKNVSPSEIVQGVWKSNREFIVSANEPHHPLAGRFESISASSLLVPLHNVGGRCKGVIHCVKNRGNAPRGQHRLFTYDDVAIVQGMEQAFGPPLETLLATEQRDFSLQKLAHELRVPVVAFQAVLERMNRECKDGEFRFRYPHFREAGIYIDLMNRLVKELDIVRKGPSEIPLVLQDTSLYTDVVIPAQRFIEPILRKRGFKPFQLTNSGFRQVPDVRVDAALITQLVFNLLENAVKYFPSSRPPAEFKCSVDARVTTSHIEIAICDNGPGISREDRERIFEFGVRGVAAEKSDVQGGGLGLWVSRAVACRHSGDLVLSKLLEPTTFLLKLPLPWSGARPSHIS